MSPKLKLTCIIDDDTIYTKLVIKLLKIKDLCSQILVFKNGKEAIDFFKDAVNEKQTLLPDLVFLDLNMPIMNGWEFLEQFELIKSELNNKPNLYVVSSSIDPMDTEKARKIELVQGYLSKPVSIKTFERIFGETVNL